MESPNKTKSARSNEHIHASDFVALCFIQCVPSSALTISPQTIQAVQSAASAAGTA